MTMTLWKFESFVVRNVVVILQVPKLDDLFTLDFSSHDLDAEAVWEASALSGCGSAMSCKISSRRPHGSALIVSDIIYRGRRNYYSITSQELHGCNAAHYSHVINSQELQDCNCSCNCNPN